MSSRARADGRTPAMMRQIKLERALLARADGSARWEQDRTVVLAAVYGPREVRARKENTDRMVIEVNHRPASGVQTAADKAKEFAIRRVLEQVVLTSMHPRLGVTVVIQIVGDDGAAESCALNAAGLALMDAAVPMRGVLCAATVARTTTTSPRKREDAPLVGDEESGDCGRLIVDPTAGEERDADGALTAAFCFRGGRVGETPPAALPTAEVEVLHAAYRSSGEAIVPRGGGVGFDSGGGEDGDGGEASTLAFLEATALARDAARGVFECVRASARRFAQRAEAELEAFVQRARALADERAKQRGRPSRAEPARAIGEEERERDEPTTSD